MRKMIYITILIGLCAIVFLILLKQETKQIKKMTAQLREYNQDMTDMKLNMVLSNKYLEGLAVEINQTIDQHAEANAHTYRIERELKQAIAGMSHDLRTPLTSMIGYMKLLENRDLTETKKEEYLEVAQKRAIRLQKLLNVFFALSIVDSEDYQIHLDVVTMNYLITENLLSYTDYYDS